MRRVRRRLAITSAIRKCRSAARTRRPCRLVLEPLEDRTLLAAFAVNSTADTADAAVGDGACDVDLGTTGDQCTLRAAIQEANARLAMIMDETITALFARQAGDSCRL